jgi:hypothetical protein
LSGNDYVIKYPDIENFRITQRSGNPVVPTILGKDKISFQTTAGTTYDIAERK